MLDEIFEDLLDLFRMDDAADGPGGKPAFPHEFASGFSAQDDKIFCQWLGRVADDAMGHSPAVDENGSGHQWMGFAP